MESFERPVIEPIGNCYQLAHEWNTDCKGVLPAKICIPVGFVTDGASIPRCLWPICGSPMDAPRIFAAIVHDYYYSVPDSIPCLKKGEVVWKSCHRSDADKLYRDYQIAMGISKFKAYAEFCALRVFGGSHWRT